MRENSPIIKTKDEKFTYILPVEIKSENEKENQKNVYIIEAAQAS